ncbi:outer membrane protein assembly factor BamB family protein [Streptomyces sp. NPDC002845]
MLAMEAASWPTVSRSDDASAGPPSGLAPGVFVKEWETRVEGASELGYDAPTRTLFLWYSDGGRPWSPHRLFVLNADTGTRRWMAQPAGWDIQLDYLPDDYVLGNVAVVVGTDPSGRFGAAALDVEDGDLLWTRFFPKDYPEIAFLRDAVVVQTSASTVRALDAAGGGTRWTWSTPTDCTVEVVRGSAELVVVETACGDRHHLRSLDPRTGRELWRHRIDTRGGPQFGPSWTVKGGMVGLSYQDQMWAYNKGGETVFDRPSGATCVRGLRGQGCFATADDVGVLSFHTGRKPVVEAVDLRDGTRLWRHSMGQPTWFETRGESLHIFGTFPEPLFPHYLATVDLRSGTYLLNATPIAFDGTAEFIGIVDERVVLSEKHRHTTAYRIKPRQSGFFGGAPPRAWPDACTLLSPEQVEDAVPNVDRYEAVPDRLAFLSTSLPEPVTCRYRPDPLSGPVATVSIIWVADTAQRAQQILGRFADGAGKSREILPEIGDSAAWRVPWTGQDSHTVYFRVGRHLASATVDSPDDSAELAQDLAQKAAEGLRSIG